MLDHVVPMITSLSTSQSSRLTRHRLRVNWNSMRKGDTDPICEHPISILPFRSVGRWRGTESIAPDESIRKDSQGIRNSLAMNGDFA